MNFVEIHHIKNTGQGVIKECKKFTYKGETIRQGQYSDKVIRYELTYFDGYPRDQHEARRDFLNVRYDIRRYCNFEPIPCINQVVLKKEDKKVIIDVIMPYTG